VSVISFTFAAVAASNPFSLSMRLIVRALTLDRFANSSNDQPSAALAIIICLTETLDISAICPILVHMDDKLQNTWKHFIHRLEGAYAPNTIKAYYADITHFVDWCERSNLIALPTSCSVVQSYLEAALAQYALTTIKRRLYAVRKINMLMGFSDPTRTEDFYLAFRRLKRAKPNRPHQAKGVNYELLLEMIDAQPRSLIGHRNRALLSLGYDFLARRSELAALKFEYLEFLPDGTLRGMIPKSKADQLGYGRLTFGSRRSAGLLKTWLKKKPKSIHWLFCPISHGKCLDRHLCDRSASEIVKFAVRQSGKSWPVAAQYSGHSLRIGAAQDLLIKGHDTLAIMRAGGWRSLDSVNGYLKFAEHNVWAS